MGSPRLLGTSAAVLAGFGLLAFGSQSTAPDLPSQTLCDADRSTAGWLRAELADREAVELAESLLLHAPTTVCPSTGTTIEGRLVWVLVETLELGPDGEVVRRRDLIERGANPTLGRVERPVFDLKEEALRITLALDD